MGSWVIVKPKNILWEIIPLKLIRILVAAVWSTNLEANLGNRTRIERDQTKIYSKILAVNYVSCKMYESSEVPQHVLLTWNEWICILWYFKQNFWDFLLIINKVLCNLLSRLFNPWSVFSCDWMSCPEPPSEFKAELGFQPRTPMSIM